MRTRRLAIIPVVAAFVATLLAYPRLPAEIAVHWGVSGQPDGYMSKMAGAFLLPMLTAVVILFFELIPRIDPLADNIERFMREYDRFVVLLAVFLAYVQGLVLWWNLGGTFAMTQALVPALAALYVYIGFLFEHARQNWFIGIRTPWTLSDEAVWHRTHARAAPLFKLSGVIALAALFVPAYRIVLLVGPVLAASLYAVVYSYRVYQERER